MTKQRSRTRRSIQRLIPAVALALLAVCNSPVYALEDVEGSSLQDSCASLVSDPEGSAGISCASYLQGYLAATEGVILSGKRPSAFLVRALKTRGSRLSEASERELVGSYCLPQEASILDLAGKIIQVSDVQLPATASELVSQILEQHYLCAESES
ncbi:hypothetical protein AUP74_02502 [Microbulbifer aggregans]|uniref:Rap1a immunity protein domain-containing protein n=1 Tax=Microbulbifer aggregans TaxID=1769779 RepID=A0A1C9W9S4_9GAMM|nr:hypothetical protein [Microbulbifer aggregans]AOS97899.1 hypothetical protein AUP74_02502 [Microbulbifer aggregans]